jgi:hypothetical protein
MSTHAKKFYYYSQTNRRTVLQEKPKGNIAYTLLPIGKEIDLRADPHREATGYMVTTVFGKAQDKYKLESRIMRGFDAVNWASWIKSENPGKEIKIWKIQDGNNC